MTWTTGRGEGSRIPVATSSVDVVTNFWGLTRRRHVDFGRLSATA